MSAFYPDLKTTFVHIPKCGGSFIENILSKVTKQEPVEKLPLVGRHATYFQILNKSNKVFSQVREPVSWYVSYYRFCKDKKQTKWEPTVWHPTDILSKCDWSEFNKWVKSIQRLRPSFLTRMYESFLGDERMSTGIKIFRLEDMPGSLKDIFKYLELDCKIPEVLDSDYNKSISKIPRVSNQTIRLIKKTERNIYERFY